jgi:hypothetical protein
MYYMGFNDLFDHLLEHKKVQDKPAATTKTSSALRPRSSMQPRLTRNSRRTDLQTNKPSLTQKSK